MLPAALARSLPAGTRLVEHVDGFMLELGTAGTIRVRDRRRPLRGARAIVVASLRDEGIESVPGAVLPIERVDTVEGHPATVATIGEGPAARWIGAVFGDDDYCSVVAIPGTDRAAWATLCTHARQVMLELPSGRARLRRRWFAYTPPPGWGCLRRHTLITEWIPPEFPRDRSMLTVFPARPINESAAGTFDRSLHEMRWGGYASEFLEGPAKLVTATLGGVRWKLVGKWRGGERTLTEVAVLHDYSFVYVIRIDTPAALSEHHRAVFATLVDSVVPIAASNASALEHG